MASNLRLVTWNVCDDVARKIVHLERLTPGIAVLQEVRPSGLSSVGLDKSSLWVGEAGQKGLAIIAYGGWALTPVAPVDERWFVAARARRGEDSIHIVGVWADSSRDCGPLTLRAIDTLKDVLTSAPCIMAGDFNRSVRLDAGKGQGRRFSTVVKPWPNLDFQAPGTPTRPRRTVGRRRRPTFTFATPIDPSTSIFRSRT
jgi:hypothetical protein